MTSGQTNDFLSEISEGTPTSYNISYIDGMTIYPEEPNQRIRKSKNPSIYGFYWIDYLGGGSTIWSTNFVGIVYKERVKDPWKWEQLQYQNIEKSGTSFPCVTHEMVVTCGLPIISTNGLTATVVAGSFSYKLDVLFQCLGGMRLRHFEGSNFLDWVFAAN